MTNKFPKQKRLFTVAYNWTTHENDPVCVALTLVRISAIDPEEAERVVRALCKSRGKYFVRMAMMSDTEFREMQAYSLNDVLKELAARDLTE